MAANPVLLGDDLAEDRSSLWFVVAAEPDGQPLVVVDLADARRGRCYDAFHETYGLAGDMATVAPTFVDLLTALVGAHGAHWYWLEPGWTSLGDAYA